MFPNPEKGSVEPKLTLSLAGTSKKTGTKRGGLSCLTFATRIFFKLKMFRFLRRESRAGQSEGALTNAIGECEVRVLDIRLRMLETFFK